GARPAIVVRAPSCIHGGTNGERTLNRAGMSIRRQWAALVTHPTNHDFMAFFHLSERTPGRYRSPMDRMPVPGDLSSSTVKGWGRRLTLGGGEGMTDQEWPARPMRITRLEVPMSWPLHDKDTPCPFCGQQIDQLNGRRQAL